VALHAAKILALKPTIYAVKYEQCPVNFPVRWTSASLLVSCERDLSFPAVINLEIDSKQSKIVLVQVNSIQANFFLLSRHSASLEKICLLTIQTCSRFSRKESKKEVNCVLLW
jgi:hypothetical protein